VNVSDCTFDSNFGNFGGAVFNSSSSLRMKRSTFVGNSASRGGAVHSGTNSWIVNCFFGGNSGDRGGALYASAPGHVVNSVFSRNFAVSSGGAVWAASSINASSCTFHGNTALLFGGGLYCEAGTTNVTNAILWSNTDNTGSGQAAQVTRVGGTLNVNRSCLQGWTGSLGGLGNIGVAPLFVNPFGSDGVPGTVDDDFRLSLTSPCVDVGDAALVLADATDLDGDSDDAEPTPLDYMLSTRRVEHVFCPPNGPVTSPPLDMGAVELIPPPRVLGDANGDQSVDFADITAVLANWGLMLVPGDVDDSGMVDFADLTLVLSNWGNSV
jgi:predicted outer membrane repeat protein